MKSKFLRNSGLFLLSVLLAGCPASKPASPATTDGKIVIKGSNTIGEELAPRLIAEYKKEHPAADFDLESKATGYGLANLLAGQCDIAGASRMAIKDELQLAQSRDVELKDNIIGSYSVAVVVNPGNPVANLTQEQVRDIFTGAVQNWKDVGGPDAPIHMFIRDPISGTYLGFKELAMENRPYGPGPKLFPKYEDIVQGVAQDANGIGYSSIELAATSGIKPVSIGGVAPTLDSVKLGKYPYTRVLRFYTNKTKEAPAARDFVQFVQSTRGQQILEQVGFVAHP
ncbi:MAG: phosphate binding protein [Pedosphaera sp.]|nr:phosphate binding protein [Pedosphaera sp.]